MGNNSIPMIQWCGAESILMDNLAKEGIFPQFVACVRSYNGDITDPYVTEYYYEKTTNTLWVRYLGDEMTPFEMKCEEYGQDYHTDLATEKSYIEFMKDQTNDNPYFELAGYIETDNEPFTKKLDSITALYKRGLIPYEDMVRGILEVSVTEYNKAFPNEPITTTRTLTEEEANKFEAMEEFLPFDDDDIII